MSDEQDKPTLTRKPLGLKRTVESGQVQQQFSHGRRNTVVVEVKRRRVLGRPGETAAPEMEEVEAAPAPAAPAPAPVAAAPVAPPPPPRPAATPRVSEASSLMSRQERQVQLLREAEESRMNALEETRRREEAARARAIEDE